MSDPIHPLGRLLSITHGGQRAEIYEIGATIHCYTTKDRHVIHPGPARDGIFDVYKGSHGALLMPWPNRVARGQYEFEGARLQLPINEVARGHASHGFARVFPWEIVAHETARLVLKARFYAQLGYPFVWESTMTYTLTDDGLAVNIYAANLGNTKMPFGVGMHPYFATDEKAWLNIPADLYDRLDDRMIPTGKPEPVTNTKYDFREGLLANKFDYDTPLTGLNHNAKGICTTVLTHGDNAVTRIWMNDAFEYMMIYNGSKPDSIAIEPMSCAPNAFNNLRGLRVLNPGEAFHGRWGCSLIPG